MRKVVMLAVAVIAVGISAQGSNADQPVSPADYERASKAALEATGGGTVHDVERENEGGSAWEVEITTAAGKRVEVQLDAQFRVLSVGDERDANEGPDDNDGPGGDDD